MSFIQKMNADRSRKVSKEKLAKRYKFVLFIAIYLLLCKDDEACLAGVGVEELEEELDERVNVNSSSNAFHSKRFIPSTHVLWVLFFLIYYEMLECRRMQEEKEMKSL